MTTLIFPHKLLETLYQYARQGFPEEICGILIGRDLADQRLVERLIPAANVASAALRPDHFTIAPVIHLEAQRTALAHGQMILGFYHSHPNGTAHPSNTDLELAWPVYSYVIVGVMGGRVTEVTSWILNATGDQFIRQELVESAATDQQN